MTRPVEDHLPATPSRRPWLETVRSFLTVFAGEGVARIFGLVTILVLARELGPSGFGVVAFGTTVVVWFALVADAGTEMLSARDVARDPSRFREIAEAVVGLRLVLSLACALAVAIGAVLLARSEANRDVYVLFALVLPAAALNLRWITMGVRGAGLIAIGNIAGQAVLMAGVLLVVTGDDDVVEVPLLYVAAELVYAAVILALLVPRFGVLRPRVDRAIWRSTLRGGLPLMISALARGALFAIDLLVITVVLGPSDAGQYSAGSRPVLFAITAVGIFFYAFVVSYTTTPGEERLSFVRTSVRSTTAASVTIALLLTALSVPLVSLLFGDAYHEAALVLAILAWKVPASAIGSTFSAILLAHGRQLSLMWNYVVGALASAALVVIAAPLFGVPGVAVASVLSSFLVTVLTIRSARTHGGPGLRDVLLGPGDGRSGGRGEGR